MPLDPRIPLGIQAPQGVNPLEIMQTVAQVQGIHEQTEARRLASEEARTRRTRQQQIDQAYEAAVKVDPKTGRVTVDRSVLVGHLPGALVPGVMKELDADEQNVLNLQTATLNLHKAKQQHLGSAAQTVVAAKGDPTIWGVHLRGARELDLIDDETYERLSAITDPQQILSIAQSYVQQAGIKPPEGFTLGRGQVRFGPTGEKIAEGLEPEPPTPSYQQKDVLLDGKPALVTFDAHSGKSFLGQEDVTARVRPLPPQGPGPERIVSVMGPDGKPVYVRESQAVGRTPGGAGGADGGVKLSPAQQEDVSTMLTVEQLIGDIQAIDTKMQDLPGVGPFEGRFFASARGSGGPTGETLRNKIGNIQGTIAKLRGGTSFTPTEQALLETYTPTTTDTDAAIRTKLASLADFIQKKRANTLRVAAGEYTLPAAAGTTTTTTAGANPFRK